MSFGLEIANSWTISPAHCTGLNSSEYTVFFKNCFRMPLDRHRVLWLAEHPTSLYRSIGGFVHLCYLQTQKSLEVTSEFSMSRWSPQV